MLIGKDPVAAALPKPAADQGGSGLFGGEEENEDDLGIEQLTDMFIAKQREFMSLLRRGLRINKK
jgi:hypothetical protein